MKHFFYYVMFSSCLWKFLEALYYKKEVLENTYSNEAAFIPSFKFGEKSYYVGELKLTYFEADQFCRNIDMKLVAVHSDEELEALWGYIRNSCSERQFWTSGSRLLDENNWIWMSTLEVVEFTKWKTGEPNNQYDEKCLELSSSANKRFLFNDKNCKEKLAFICEKDGSRKLVQENKPKQTYLFQNSYVSPNINLLHFGKKNYYIGNNFKATFLEASQFCQMIHMHLVSINSEAENNRLHKYIRDTMAGYNFWSSGTKAVDGKNWIWLSTGTTIGYTNWQKNQPDHSDEQCLELIQNNEDGLFWNDAECSKQFYFICEDYGDSSIYEIEPSYSSSHIVTRSADGHTYSYQYEQYQESEQVKAKEETEKKAREEAERKAKQEAEKKAKEKAEKKAREEAEKKAKEEAEKKAKEKAEKEAKKKVKEEAERKEKEAKKEKKEKEHKKDALKYEITLDGGRYRFSNIKVNHEEASEICKQYGLELINIPNKEKNDFIYNLIEQYGKSDGKYWTSGTKRSDDLWIWGDLQPITYFNWAPSEPDKDQYCLQVRATGLWHDQDCDRNSLFICEYSVPSYSNTYNTYQTYQAYVEPYYSK